VTWLDQAAVSRSSDLSVPAPPRLSLLDRDAVWDHAGQGDGPIGAMTLTGATSTLPGLVVVSTDGSYAVLLRRVVAGRAMAQPSRPLRSPVHRLGGCWAIGNVGRVIGVHQ
jgi:hypothetical protein